MTKPIINKTFYQMIIGFFLSIIYMQIRPYESYTLSWPFCAYGAWFMVVSWFVYLKHDKLSIYKMEDEMKKDRERKQLVTKHKTKSFMDYVNAPIYGNYDYTEKEQYKIKLTSDLITCVFFFTLGLFFI